MGITYYIKPEYSLNILVHTGKITDDEFITFYRNLFENSSFEMSINQLVDLRESDSTPRSQEALQLFADMMQARVETLAIRPKVAIIAPVDLSFGLARMYEVFARSVRWDLAVFRSTDSALAWLGLPLDLIDEHEEISRAELNAIL